MLWCCVRFRMTPTNRNDVVRPTNQNDFGLISNVSFKIETSFCWFSMVSTKSKRFLFDFQKYQQNRSDFVFDFQMCHENRSDFFDSQLWPRNRNSVWVDFGRFCTDFFSIYFLFFPILFLFLCFPGILLLFAYEFHKLRLDFAIIWLRSFSAFDSKS